MKRRAGALLFGVVAAAPGAAGATPLQAHFERWALHALLEPVLEPEEPQPVWRAPPVLLNCLAGTTVHVDGRRLAPGQPLAAREVRVAWHAVGCRPFGPDGVELSGDVTLTLHVGDTRWTARVEPQGLRLTGPAGDAVTLRQAFDAAMPVAPARSGGTGRSRSMAAAHGVKEPR